MPAGEEIRPRHRLRTWKPLQHTRGFTLDLCLICGRNPVAIAGKTSTGRLRFKRRCEECIKRSRAVRLNSFRDHILKHKKSKCEECGFEAQHPCQLDVDHVDGNRENSDPSNLRTLCANCHRLKTQRNGDHKFFKTRLEIEPGLFD
jgi:hypothetical protein